MPQPRRPSGRLRLRYTAILIVAAVAAFALTARSAALPAAPAVEAPGLTVLAQHGGTIGSLAVSDDAVVYVAVGSRIEAYNVADPSRPVLLGSSPPLPALVQTLALDIDRQRLYATVYRGGLHGLAVDGDPVPRLLGSLPGVAQSVTDLHVVENAAILGDRSAGLVIVDVSDPAAPRHTATVAVRTASDSEETMEVSAVGRRGSDLAVVATTARSANHQLVLYDASDSSSPIELGRVQFEVSNATGAVWLGDHVYTGSARGLHPIDVSDFAAPRALEVVPPPEGMLVGGVFAGEDQLYQLADLGMQENGLAEYALDDPARPALVTIHRDGPWGAVHAAGKSLYSLNNFVRTSGNAALSIYERADDGAFHKRGGIHLSLGVVAAAAVGPMMWFTGSWALLAVDPTDPRRPAWRWPTDWPVGPIAAGDGRIYVASGREGLHAVDVSDPSAPRDLAGISLAAPAVDLRNVALEGDRGYAIAWRGRRGLPSDLMVFDAGRAEGPVILGALPLAVGWNGRAPLLPMDGILLVGSDAGETHREIAIVDFRDPAAPVEIHRLPMVDHVWTLARGQGGTVYAGTDTSLIQFDLTSAPPFLVERARWRPGEEGAERAVLAMTVVGNDVHVLLSFGTDPSTSHTLADANGYEAAIHTLRPGTDGELRVIDEVPVPANLFTSATNEIVATASHLGVVGSASGFTILGQAGERRAGALYLPLLWRNDPGR